MISKKQVVSFQKYILDWYQQNQRDLPWRKTREPYSILVSEVMSQQTQLSRVIPKYVAWLEKFPTVEKLATAKISDVLRYWSGLGYNRRALHLKKTAELIEKEYNGRFPVTEKELLTLPGIGQYTARAVLCFAFDQQIAVVDTNVKKVIVTKFLQVGDHKTNQRLIEEIATKLLPVGLAYEWNQALMDYAAEVLKNEKIPIPRQSKFIGSHRFYRGQILKQLLQKKKIPIQDIGFLIKKDYSENEKQWLLNLLDELSVEGFIFIKNDFVLLAS
jgi:A/G-specific adenine glycosylase